MNNLPIPNHWSPHQALAILDFLEALHQAIWDAQFNSRDSARMFLDGLDVPGVLNGRDALNKSLFVWAKSFLPNYILNLLGDRMEMAHSVEGRVPFLDHHVVECLCRVPVALKIHGMTEKYLLREAARPVITDTVYRRQKTPLPLAARDDGAKGAFLPASSRCVAWARAGSGALL